ncbi:MAG: CPBP family intramembrane metalloprotease [Saprospiraceae bacterium]|nr:CPBP family intramembrane metalloprotease [Saprospiraceae bacterium]
MDGTNPNRPREITFRHAILRKFTTWMLGLTGVFIGITWLAIGDADVTEIAGGLILQILALVPIGWFIWQHLEGQIDLKRFFRGSHSSIPLLHLILLVILILLVSYGLDILMLDLVNTWNTAFVEDVLEVEILSADQSAGINILTFILAVVMAPLMEELVFRGLILQRLMVKYGPTSAIWASSLLFGLLHFDALFSASLFGVVMCLFFLKTKNLWVPIFVHWTNNATVLGLDFWMQSKQLKTLDALDQYSWFALILIVAIPASIYLIRKWWPANDCLLPYEISNIEAP